MKDHWIREDDGEQHVPTNDEGMEAQSSRVQPQSAGMSFYNTSMPHAVSPSRITLHSP